MQNENCNNAFCDNTTSVKLLHTFAVVAMRTKNMNTRLILNRNPIRLRWCCMQLPVKERKLSSLLFSTFLPKMKIFLVTEIYPERL